MDFSLDLWIVYIPLLFGYNINIKPRTREETSNFIDPPLKAEH